ncbi:MAG TPA: rod shape-determining protein RodA [bacterium]|nr:rod shape-determining protein RodA [bacterium]
MLQKPSRRLIQRNPNRRFVGRIDRRVFANFDWTLLILVVLLFMIGLLNLYSATNDSDIADKFQLQLVWMVVGFVLMCMAFLVNYQYFESAAYGILIAINVMLLATLIIGQISHGAQRWLMLGPVRFQPSELAKIAVILALAKFLAANRTTRGYNLKELGIPMALAGGPIFLTLLQPDLGTAIMIGLIAFSMIAFVGIRLRTFLGISISTLAVGVFGFLFLLHDYQRDRIMTLFDPSRDPLGTGYHIQQSKIAIGSGQFFGKGWLQGTQAKLQFLPEHHTDFVFSVLAEEWGFIGGLVVLALFFALIAWSLTIATRSKDHFGTLVAVGLVAFLFWHIFINIGMVLGIMPVVGVPLPFLSYGRTSMLTVMMAIGLLLNISSRRYMF